ncbi:hypothetical protein ALPO108162_06855 [Alicyclobacillus pomorum]|uniref:PaaD-like zinc ribbon domain-containing protein n=1 Tax=Alicyclobacillus pomorum TaxID=204470 RepID=UPI0039F39857
MQSLNHRPSRVKATPFLAVKCPFCGSRTVRRVSQFGKVQLVSQFLCSDCRSVFERVRW